jgi:hypothetical protein
VKGRIQFARSAGHLVIWTLVLIPTAIQAASGWIPAGDDAQAVARAVDVFSLRPPLVGMVTTTFPNVAHQPYNLGPLMFWLLAVPVRLNLTTGALWGSAILCGAALSVAFESAFRNRLWVGSVITIAAAVDLAWRAPAVFFDLAWNPYFGIAFLSASVVLAYVVAAGHVGWWPVLAGFGSVAAQSHLAFAAPAIVLMVGAPLFARVRVSRWLLWGVIVGIVCWLPTMVQQFFGNPANLSLLWSDKVHQASLGIGFGLRSLTAVALAPARHPATEAVIQGQSAILGGIALLALVAVVVWATRVGQRNIAALGGVTLLMSIGIVASFTGYPKGASAAGPVTYLAPMLMLVGLLWWAVAGWVVVGLVRVHLLESRIVWGIGVLALAPIFAAIASVSQPPAIAPVVLSQVAAVNAYVDANVPHGSVNLVVPDDLLVARLAIALSLTSHGWRVGMPEQVSEYAGSLFVEQSRWPDVTITPRLVAVATCAFHDLDCSEQLALK